MERDGNWGVNWGGVSGVGVDKAGVAGYIAQISHRWWTTPLTARKRFRMSVSRLG